MFQKKKKNTETKRRQSSLHQCRSRRETCEKKESTFPVALKKKTTPAFGLPYERRGTKDGMLSLSHVLSPILSSTQEQSLLFLPLFFFLRSRTRGNGHA
jgi:hypothetical protein